MKNLPAIILLFAFCAIFAVVSLAQTSTSVKQELTTVYAAHDEAIAARDLQTIAAFYAPEYVAETKKGKIARDESLKNLQNFFEIIKEISSSKTSIERIEQIRGTQIIFLTRQIKGTMIFAAGRTREFEVNVRAEEHWTKTDEGDWTMHAAVERSQTIKIDGIEENNNVLESSRAELETVYQRIDVALKARNPKAMFVYWATDFTEVNNGKHSNSADVETAVKALFAQITTVSDVVHKITNIKTVDNNYVVEMTRTIEGEMTANGKKVPFQYGYKARESWTKNEQQTWKLKTSEIIADSFLIDGKKVQ